jgi:hypothetical protein
MLSCPAITIGKRQSVKRNSIGVSLVAIFLAYFCSPSARAQGVSYYDLVRQEFFTQATTNRASTGMAVTHDLFGALSPSSGISFESVILSSPGGARGWSLYLKQDVTSGRFFTSYEPGLTSHLARSAPGGQYLFETFLRGAATGLAFKAPLPGPANAYPPLRVSNFVEAQNVDASQPFTITWDKVAGMKVHDFLGVQVFATNGDQVFSMSLPAGLQTNLTLDAGTLQAGSNYNAEVYLIHYFTYGVSRSPLQFIREERATRFPLRTLNPAGVFRFASAGFVATNSDGVATITVERTEGSQGEVTVDYFSADGSASEGTNYLGASGTLSFKDGETSQTFDVSLLNDGVSNAPLTVHLTLANATGGARLATRPHSVLTILDAESAPGKNVEAYLLSKTEIYSQTNGTSVTQSNRSITSAFEVDLHPGFPGAITGATVQLPNRSMRQLGSGFANYQDFVGYAENFPSALSLNKAFPAGKYMLTIQTLMDGSVSIPVSLGVERKFSVPALTNWDQAQAIDAAVDFTLQLAPFASATTNDYIRIVIFDENGEYLVYTPNGFKPGVLPATTSSYTIPANTFGYGKRYEADLIFGKVVLPARQPNPGIKGGVVFLHTTVVFLNTIAGPG